MFTYTGHLFTKRADVLPQDLAKSRSCEIRVYTFPIVLKFDRHLGSTAAEMSVKYQSDTIITSLPSDLAVSILRLVNRSTGRKRRHACLRSGINSQTVMASPFQYPWPIAPKTESCHDAINFNTGDTGGCRYDKPGAASDGKVFSATDHQRGSMAWYWS